MKILVIDDDVVSLKLLANMLDKLGHEVISCEGGQKAIELLDEHTFEVVISDWVMPDVDGIQVCQHLRSLKSGTYTYFIMLTGRTANRDHLDSLRQGADDILHKPATREVLEARLTVANRILEMQTELQVKTDDLTQLAGVLETANRRVSELFKGLPIACITIDENGLIMEWNRSAEALYQLQSYEVWMQPLWEVIVASSEKKAAKEIAMRALKPEDRLDQEDWTTPLRDGRLLHLLVSTFPLRTPNGDIVGAALAIVDNTAQKQLEQRITEQLMVANELSLSLETKNHELETLSKQLEQLATTDGLTGLSNYRAFKQVLLTEMEHAKENGKDLSILLCDVDKFKSFNDEFGHLVGDEVLRRVATSMKEVVDGLDNVFLARYGGEEFVLVASGHDAEHALALANALRMAIERQDWSWRPVTASYGVCTYSPDIQDDEDFVNRADQALYVSKEHGRNRATHIRDVPPLAA
jgi:two-component system cell cycle response regulator